MRPLIVTGMMGLALLAGCTPSERAEVKQETREAGQEAKQAGREISAEARQKRLEYERGMEARLDKLDREIDEMEAKTKNAGSKAKAAVKADWNRSMAELKDERAAVRRQYTAMKNATDDGWDRLKTDMDRAADKIESGYNRVLEAMKTDGR